MDVNLHYLQAPRERRAVGQNVEFLGVDDVLRDEPLCRSIWNLATQHFKTRSKFLAIWPSVRFLAVRRHGDEAGGFLFVSAPVNWQIDYVVVDPELRHQGIAAALVLETLNQAFERQVPYVMLTSKASLRPLYEGQCGFTVVGRSETDAALASLAPGSRGQSSLVALPRKG